MNKVSVIAIVLMLAFPAWGANEAGTVKIAKGTVNIKRSGKTLTANVGTAVFPGDRVVTGADSSVGITLRDSTLLSAGPNSHLDLTQFTFNPTTHAGALDASLKRGTLAVVSGKIAKQSPNAVQFHTPSAILGVRGTEFVVAVESGETD